MTLKHGTITANQLTFGYVEAGNGPLILALHGFPDHARSFRHQAAAFAAEGYRLVAPFLRGYKPTDVAPDGIYHVAALVQDTIALLIERGNSPLSTFRSPLPIPDSRFPSKRSTLIACVKSSPVRPASCCHQS